MADYFRPSYHDSVPKSRDMIFPPDLFPRLKALGFNIFGYAPILIFNDHVPQIRMQVNEKGLMFLEMDTDDSNLLEEIVINKKGDNGRVSYIHMIITTLEAQKDYVVNYNKIAKLMNVPKYQIPAEA